ncbi:hypothetical protein ACFOPN_07045 [Xanthomonas hyacinthi]|uniref:hypothetical protein n=1 Tax=Xanthomonas hyacinthi TaxID=56455 RepID=UPI003609D388
MIRQLEDTDIRVPAALAHTTGRGVHPTLRYLHKELLHRLSSAAWTCLGGAPLANAAPSPIERDHDLFFYMCQFPAELGTLSALHNWRRRSHCAVAYLLETWPELLASQRSQLKVLNDFDHVFLLNASCVEPMRELIRTPVSFLPSACDTLLATPLPRPPERCIDVLSLGRRSASVHDKLLQHAAQHPEFFYVHDAVKGGAVLDWPAHRLQSAAMIKRTEFFLAFDFDVDRSGHFKGVRKRALATRYFEGAAGGRAGAGFAAAVRGIRRVLRLAGRGVRAAGRMRPGRRVRRRACHPVPASGARQAHGHVPDPAPTRLGASLGHDPRHRGHALHRPLARAAGHARRAGADRRAGAAAGNRSDGTDRLKCTRRPAPATNGETDK